MVVNVNFVLRLGDSVVEAREIRKKSLINITTVN